MKKSLKITLFCVSAFVFIGCDRVTKDLAKEHLMYKEPLSYFHNTFSMVYAENTGAAMNLGDSLPGVAGFWLLSMLPLVFLLLLAAYVIIQSKKMRWIKLFSFALIIAGGLGNVIDRILFNRHVTDFMIVHVGKIHTGIFNFADVCVTAGAFGLIFFYRDKQVLPKKITID